EHVQQQLAALKALVDVSRAKKQNQDHSWDELEKAIVGFQWFDNPADQMRAIYSAFRDRGGFDRFRRGRRGGDDARQGDRDDRRRGADRDRRRGRDGF
ncbi:MAG: hypothetical protein R3236_01515, partial [Phycisphaeraceae bacterium]|nr:hypothetical protein [Phycisphaeraceae bacterium]